MLKRITALILGISSLVYVFNPTAGILEIIPDVMPGVGNLDEAAAMLILFAVLRYFGLDITSPLDTKKKEVADESK
ncbi:DUF1232 domain-containing protein [Patescibacteria group bacterium]